MKFHFGLRQIARTILFVVGTRTRTRMACVVLAVLPIRVAAQDAAGGIAAGNITGDGAAHHIAVFTGTTTIRSSTIFETSTADVGINTTSPIATLDVNGTVNAATSFSLGGNAFAFGSFANQSVFLGFAGNFTTTGSWNTAVGSQALLSDTSGSYNTASGYQALLSNTTGTNNTAIGYQALFSNISGTDNSASGQGALGNNSTGDRNTAHGYNALVSNTAGTDNTATGITALNYNTTGNYSTASGSNALAYNATGSYNTAIGYNAGPDIASTNLAYATAIGANATVSESNALVLGGPLGSGANVNVGIGTATPSNVLTIAQGAGQAISDGWSTYSSRRWKTNIQTLHGALEMVEQLRGVSYDLKGNGRHEVGVIAEEVGQVMPEVVSYEENGKDARGVDYSRLTALLIEAVKQQQREIRDLKSELRATRRSLQKVEAKMVVVQPSLVAAK